MDNDTSHDDLTALFEAEDSTLTDNAFVKKVMLPIGKKSFSRQAILFGAFGIGIGAAGSQLLTLFSKWSVPEFKIEASLSSLQVELNSFGGTSSIWLITVAMVVACLAMMTVFERA